MVLTSFASVKVVGSYMNVLQRSLISMQSKNSYTGFTMVILLLFIEAFFLAATF